MMGKFGSSARRGSLWGVLIVVMLLMAACGSPAPPPSTDAPTQAANIEQPTANSPTVSPANPTTPSEPALTTAPTPEQCAANAGVVEVATHGGLVGTGIIDITVRNPQSTPMTVRLSPGCMFLPPPDSAQQRMMVLQTAEVALGAGETATLSPYLAGIDAAADVPEEGTAYSLGGMVPDARLQQLAQCLNSQQLPPGGTDNESLGVQFAVWQISDGYSLPDFREQVAAGNVDEDTLGGASPEEAADLLLPLIDELIASSQRWLTLCPVPAQ